MTSPKYANSVLLVVATATATLVVAGCPQLVEPDGANGAAEPNAAATVENHAPVADAGPDQTAVAGEVVVLDGTGTTDEDHDELMYFWEQVEGTPEVTLEDGFSSRPRFVVPENLASESRITFRLTVVDGHDVSTDEVRVTLQPG